MRLKPTLVVSSFGLAVALGAAALYFVALELYDNRAFDSGALNREVLESQSCQAQAPVRLSQANEITPTVKVAVWTMGLREGLMAGWEKQIRDGEAAASDPGMSQWVATARRALDEADASANRLAALLQVTRPALFEPENVLTELNDYRTYVESMTQPVARELASAYSPRVCEIYKMGAYWGFSILFRAAKPNQRNVFAAELSHYGERLRLRETLLLQMTERGDRKLDAAGSVRESERVSKAIAEFLNAE